MKTLKNYLLGTKQELSDFIESEDRGDAKQRLCLLVNGAAIPLATLFPDNIEAFLIYPRGF